MRLPQMNQQAHPKEAMAATPNMILKKLPIDRIASTYCRVSFVSRSRSTCSVARGRSKSVADPVVSNCFAAMSKVTTILTMFVRRVLTTALHLIAKGWIEISLAYGTVRDSLTRVQPKFTMTVKPMPML